MPDKSLSYRLSPLAESDLEDIWLYSLENWSLKQADRYILDITAVFDGLANGLKAGRKIDIRDGYLKYTVGSHVVFYCHMNTGIDIMRVLHRRMDVGRHL